MRNTHRRKRKIVVHNHINEIDYEQLGNTIKEALKPEENLGIDVEMGEEIDENEILEEDDSITLKDVFIIIWAIIRNKADSHGRITPKLFNLLISLVFNLIALSGAIIFLLVLGQIIYELITLNSWTDFWEDIAKYVWVLSVDLLLGLVSLIFRAMANEFSNENDRNYTMSVFSGIVSFAALIVALVALFKGVG